MSTSKHEPGTGRRRRAHVVLVVEDDDSIRDEVSAVLQCAGYRVLEATDGEQALRLLLSHDMPEPALIVLDMWLPRMTGQELLQVVRGYHRLERIPVIITSASQVFAHFAQVRDAGWLAKPFDADALLTEVSKRCELEQTSSPAASSA